MTAISVVSDAPSAEYQPGVVNRFLAWVDTLPWHGWWVYPGIAALLFAWSHGILWATGALPGGTIQPLFASAVVYGPYVLAVLALINGAAVRALASFWPATGWPDTERDAWRYAFVNSPGGFTLFALGLGLVAAIGAFLSAPGDAFGLERDRAVQFVAYLPAAALGYGLLPVAIFHTSRQLRLVARIHREARAIDPFDRGPVYAFSGLTVRTGLAYVAAGYYAVTVNGAFQQGNAIGLVALAATFMIGVASFIVPLWGIHDRLLHEKELLMRDAESRVTRVGEELYRRVDAGQFGGTKEVSEALAGVQGLRERISRLPTWPWPPQVFRGFISAMLLPVIVYVLSRLIGGQIGI